MTDTILTPDQYATCVAQLLAGLRLLDQAQALLDIFDARLAQHHISVGGSNHG